MQTAHPAFRAWRELKPTHTVPEKLEILWESQNSTVYRFVYDDKAQKNIIAKRSWQDSALIERTVYEEILPSLPFITLQYYGSVKESNGEYWWLFLEDISDDERYHPHIKEHRVIAAKWLGIMNRLAQGVEAAARLPARGSQHYLNLLHSASNAIMANLDNPVLNKDDLALLEIILAQCDHLTTKWNMLASACERVPQTLVHGDFIQNNVRIRYVQNEIIMLPFDWEKAGWGVPAEDISRVDITTYWSTIKDHWPGLTIQALKRLMSVGKVFRCLVLLDWIAPHLALGSVEQPIYYIRRCKTWLTDLIHTAEWQG